MLKINCGSGQRKFDPALGWTNIDTQAKWSPELVCDCSSLPYLDNSASLIVSHHQLEHVEMAQADVMLKEWYRVLAPGGSLLIFVPDLLALTRAWLDAKIDDYIFCVNLYGAYMGNDADLHRWAYHEGSLRAKLRGVAPWREAKKFDYREIPGADIAGRDWWHLGMEFVK